MSHINWSNPQSLAYIPDGKLVTFTAMHQADYTQYVQIIDANGNPITFTLMTGDQASFPISGQGTEVGFFNNGSGHFTMKSGMQVQFGSDGPHVPKVSAANPNQFFIQNAIFGGGTMYVTEDGGDEDYNDTSFVIEWYQYVG